MKFLGEVSDEDVIEGGCAEEGDVGREGGEVCAVLDEDGSGAFGDGIGDETGAVFLCAGARDEKAAGGCAAGIVSESRKVNGGGTLEEGEIFVLDEVGEEHDLPSVGWLGGGAGAREALGASVRRHERDIDRMRGEAGVFKGSLGSRARVWSEMQAGI